MPVGPATCRRCLVSTPLYVSAVRSISALASDPTCCTLAHLRFRAVDQCTSSVSRRHKPMRNRKSVMMSCMHLADEQRLVPKLACCGSLICALDKEAGPTSASGTCLRCRGRAGVSDVAAMLPFLLRMCSTCWLT